MGISFVVVFTSTRDKRMWRSTFFTLSLSSARFFLFYKSSATDVVARYFHYIRYFFSAPEIFTEEISFLFLRFLLWFTILCMLVYVFVCHCSRVRWCVCPVKCPYIIAFIPKFALKKYKMHRMKKKSGIRFQGVVDFLLSSLRSLSTMQVIFNNNHPCTDVRNRRSIWFLASLYTLFAIIGTYFFSHPTIFCSFNE